MLARFSKGVRLHQPGKLERRILPGQEHMLHVVRQPRAVLIDGHCAHVACSLVAMSADANDEDENEP